MENYKKIKDRTIYTNDNWKTYFTNDRIKKSQEYIDENDRDIEKIQLLRIELGEIKTKILLDEYRKIRDLFYSSGYKCNTMAGFGNEFEVFSIAVKNNVDYETVIKNHIVHGNYDGGIDGIYWDDKDLATVYQVKSSSANTNTKKNMKEKIVEYINKGKLTDKNDEDLQSYLEQHWTQFGNKTFNYTVISTNTDDSSVKKIYESFFRNRLIPMTENNFVLTLPIETRKDLQENLVTNVTLVDKKIYIFTINALELKKSILNIKALEQGNKLYKLFYDNVRGSLGINESINSTIKNKKEREYFVDFNNGVSISGVVNFKEESGICITNPTVSNGQQTLTNIISYENNKDLEDFEVVILVKNTNAPSAPKSLNSKIAQYTNTQKPVKTIDLLSLNNSIRITQSQLFDEGIGKKTLETGHVDGFFLDIYSNGKKGYEDLLSKLYLKENIIKLSAFLRLFGALKEPQKIGNWKSKINESLKETFVEKAFNYNKKQFNLVCECIKKYNQYLNQLPPQEKNDFKSADLAFQYIMAKYKTDEEKTFEIINLINEKYFYSLHENRPSKLIDLYKSNLILDKIEEAYSNISKH